MPLCGCCGSRTPCSSLLQGQERTSSVAELRRRAREHSEAIAATATEPVLHRQ